MLALLCFCVAAEFSVNKDVYFIYNGLTPTASAPRAPRSLGTPALVEDSRQGKARNFAVCRSQLHFNADDFTMSMEPIDLQ